MTFARDDPPKLLDSMGEVGRRGYLVREVALSSVLVVNEISTEREEIARALEAEGFTVVHAPSAAEAVREIWGGSFIVAVISTLLTGTTSTALQSQLAQMAPELETLIHGKNDELPALVRKVMAIRDGEAAA
jgi:DNA-binding NtrC family response regulator